jgi:acetylornithine/LysW-gamma-L-lysine aminotransferase
MRDFEQIEDQYSLSLFQKRGITLVKGKNARVWDKDGKEYIDCTAGHGVASIGHANDELVAALSSQAAKLITCTGSFYNEERAKLMEKLVEISPDGLEKVFLCNSGAESVEAAIKFARLSTGKTDFICAMRGFHGRTLGALSATHNPKYREDFQPLIPGFHFVPYNNFEKIKEMLTEATAAIILEVIQGEGGVHPADPEYMKQVQAICKEREILLIIDEVQTGFGRTGKLFACEHYDLKPDLLCLSKAIGGGFPIGAVLCSSSIKVSLGKHGTTFGGNPLACAAALASINFLLKNDLPEQSAKKGQYFVEKFPSGKLEKVREVRQIGLMIGIELKEKSQPYITKLQEMGVLTIPAGATVIRLLPPLTIEYEQLDIVIDSLIQVLSNQSEE